MVKIILHGCNGRMGQMLTGLLKEDPQAEVAAGVDGYTGIANDYPVFPSIDECNVQADVVIDFSNAKAADGLLDYCVRTKTPVVLCTTGLSEEQLAKVEEAAKETAVLKSANMSLGINLLMKLLKEAAPTLAAAGFDIEIVEKHHNQKLDAPSGTALMLAQAASDGVDYHPEFVYERHSVRKKRDKTEIGISAIRGGTIVGEHDVIFAGRDEVLTLSHAAMSKEIFAVGALNAALFLHGRPAGFYSMTDVVNAV